MIGTIKIGDQEHPIKLGTYAFNTVENITGMKNAFDILSKWEENVSSNVVSALVYGAIKNGYILQKEKCPVTFEEVAANIAPTKLGDYIAHLFETLDLPEAKETEDDKKKLN